LKFAFYSAYSAGKPFTNFGVLTIYEASGSTPTAVSNPSSAVNLGPYDDEKGFISANFNRDSSITGQN